MKKGTILPLEFTKTIVIYLIGMVFSVSSLKIIFKLKGLTNESADFYIFLFLALYNMFFYMFAEYNKFFEV